MGGRSGGFPRSRFFIFFCFFSVVFFLFFLSGGSGEKADKFFFLWRRSFSFSGQERKLSPKRKFLGTDIPWTSGGSFARISRPKTSVRAVKILEKNKHFSTDIHDPNARTSTTLKDFQKLRSIKLWAGFSFPTWGLSWAQNFRVFDFFATS